MEINQIQAAFRFQHSYERKRCPDRSSSNSKLYTHVCAHYTKTSKQAEESSPGNLISSFSSTVRSSVSSAASTPLMEASARSSHEPYTDRAFLPSVLAGFNPKRFPQLYLPRRPRYLPL
ncbi:hypothetical protein XANCAGTX0491_003102 [Xanthoria calcicola]